MLPDKCIHTRDFSAKDTLLEGVVNMSKNELKAQIHKLLVKFVLFGNQFGIRESFYFILLHLKPP